MNNMKYLELVVRRDGEAIFPVWIKIGACLRIEMEQGSHAPGKSGKIAISFSRWEKPRN